MNDINPKILRDQTVKAAADALKLELKFMLGDYPSDEEWKAWLKGFRGDYPRMLEIVKKRNLWASKFSERIPDFQRLLEKHLGI
jgi:hypothetical protein